MNRSQGYSETLTVPKSQNSSCSIEAPFQFYLFPIVYSIVFVLGLIGNVAVLYIFIVKVKKTSPSYLYFINLAVVDVLFVCTLPFRIFYHIKKNDWPFGDVMCQITGTVYFANIYVSIAFLSCICVDRYIAVVHPRKYLRIKYTHYPRVIVALVWVGALAVMLPLNFEGPLTNIRENKTACFENFSAVAWSERMAAYNTIALLSGFLIPFSIIIICYPLMAKKVARLKNSKRKTKALKMIFLILAMSIVCFIPYHVTHLFYLLARLDFIQDCAFKNFLYKTRRVTMAMVSFNTCLDPLLYYLANIKFKLSFFKKSRPLQKVYSVTTHKFEKLTVEDATHQQLINTYLGSQSPSRRVVSHRWDS
ncbi:lysophosphatidic acid receptor 6 isoform X2 [Callorhinchus milii]|uniref:Lysophosphatidic acid receptor 6-like n=2 Tax=Callorhinchus milii TaxID=7868 RepID=A0A4W3GUN3_CALMI|nr:lysophosphatidic acid receptor 6 isoform X2 [Callorhinchus milii]|eukprot:gi/632967950/ref/XP_007900267.1/ PREDICTED: lysophosphatidic acid receptor 6-like isoform X2 [Callorhinchus milii]